MPLVQSIPRREFLNSYLDINAGEHLVSFEPTQQGKTRLLYEILAVAKRQNPGVTVCSMMPKSLDPATMREARAHDLKVIDNWPPPPSLGRKPAGHVLWPKHLTGVPVKRNREYLAGIFRRALADLLRKGSSIAAIDDAHQLAVILGLNMEIEETLTTGGGAGASAFLTGQKASGTRQGALTSFAYNSATHLIFGWEPYAANRKRLDDISGVDMHLVARIVPQLQRHRILTPSGPKNISEKLYIRKDGPYMAIIGV